ncbi:hypothetical protein SY94_0843 [Agrobacterium tumefaciens]|nr:hypothetical protein SY94_0843 [Agrobacterium tumefaciens]
MRQFWLRERNEWDERKFNRRHAPASPFRIYR